MKVVLLAYLLLAAWPARAQRGPAARSADVYLLLGQSNMAGRGLVDTASRPANPRILMLDSTGRWVPATDPVHFDKPKVAGVGPAISFAQAMLGRGGRHVVKLVPCALGGSPLRVWQPGAVYLGKFHPYDDALARARLAMQYGTLRGILWHQGESDNDSTHAARYLANLTQLIQRLRTDLHQPGLPFVAGEIGYFNKANYINPLLRQLPQLVPATAVVSAAGLTDKGDKLHFDAASARELGRRYAQAMQQLSPPGRGQPPGQTKLHKRP